MQSLTPDAYILLQVRKLHTKIYKIKTLRCGGVNDEREIGRTAPPTLRPTVSLHIQKSFGGDERGRAGWGGGIRRKSQTRRG